MRIGFISTRLNGTDGVSLEVEKWSTVLARMGNELFFCAGELGGYAKRGTLIDELHFHHPTVRTLSNLIFGVENTLDPEDVINQIYHLADEIRSPLRRFIQENKLDLIIVQNASSIPMNVPLGVCLTGLIAEMGINTIAHHHDFYWERERYQSSNFLDLLDHTFPANLPSVQHVTINSIASRKLKARRSIDSVVIPNVHDFANPPAGPDGFTQGFRAALGLSQEDILVLQPTRVIRRKGVELSIELVNRLKLPTARLLITHRADDEGPTYWHWLEREATIMGVDLSLIDHLIGAERSQIDGHKIYSLWDVYPHADLVTYPSLYEGFGNALLEAVYFKRLVVINRYPVYNADIRPKGFQFIELYGYVSQEAVDEIAHLLKDTQLSREIAEKNYGLAREYYSYEVLEQNLRELLARF